MAAAAAKQTGLMIEREAGGYKNGRVQLSGGVNKDKRVMNRGQKGGDVLLCTLLMCGDGAA